MTAKLLATVTCLFLAGCATPYEKRTGRFGYDDFRITKDVFEVSFSGNAKTAPSVVNKYVFRRACELTLQNGFTHFIPISEVDRSMRGSVNQGSSSGSTYVSPNGRTAYSHGSASGASVPFEMPSTVMRIRCVKDPAQDEEGWVNASEFLKYNFPELGNEPEAAQDSPSTGTPRE